MQTRSLPNSGLEVSVVGLGCNNFGGRSDFEETKTVVHQALDSGITFFDTADCYPVGNQSVSEQFLGRILGARRKDIVLATKFGIPMDDSGKRQGASRRYIIAEVEASLTRLKTDWIDLYQLHKPDPQTPIEETLRALDDLIHQGKVRYIGCSNMPAWQVTEARWMARELGLNGFVCCQDEYSLLQRAPEHELIPAISAYGLGLIPYFPLAGGFLTGKYKRTEKPPVGTRLAKNERLSKLFMTEANWNTLEGLEKFCAARGHSMVDLAFAWLLARPFIPSVIAGATKAEQITQNIQASEWVLDDADLAEIDALTT